MTVEQMIREHVVTATRDTTASVLADLMRENAVGSVVIIEGERPLGIVTDRDLAIELVGMSADPSEIVAESIMTTNPTTTDVDDGLFELTELMCEVGVRRIPVIEEGALAGIVTLDDMTRLLVAELGNLAGVIEAESPLY